MHYRKYAELLRDSEEQVKRCKLLDYFGYFVPLNPPFVVLMYSDDSLTNNSGKHNFVSSLFSYHCIPFTFVKFPFMFGIKSSLYDCLVNQTSLTPFYSTVQKYGLTITRGIEDEF